MTRAATNRPSVRARALNGVLRLIEKRRLARIEHPEELRQSFERSARLMFHGPRGSRYVPDRLENVPALKVRGPGADDRELLLYFHGGGYVMGSPATHRAMLARISALTGRVAVMPDYRKAPEHPFPAAIDDALAAYGALIAAGPSRRIVLGGDSAGGGIALALLGQICRLGLPQPAATFAFSPLTDMTFSGDSFRDNAVVEAMLPTSRAKDLEVMYLNGADPRDPRASPLFADFAGVGPVWMCVGDTEILRDDTLRMAAVLRRQGVEVNEVIARDLPHVWPIFQRIIPEAEATLTQVSGWIRSL
ncbi:alpha/beta hydrolase [Marimonas arenosa]|uniref:Alpha/beta hydrolase n=1 Tax=Marimonas arenosa TaxID=1795305 RepID=A0AAE3WHY4_9RHOB|nr:alpha/beta hydrolase [Marimonas arenosa]MDQ2092147.1 alpha/beta hydrolase [Marimonas arenosa]